MDDTRIADAQALLDALPSLSALQIRIRLGELGWQSTDEVGSKGWSHRVGYSVWVSRNDWHGQPTEDAEFWACTVTPTAAAVDDTVRRVATRALQAWCEHQTTVPAPAARRRRGHHRVPSQYNTQRHH